MVPAAGVGLRFERMYIYLISWPNIMLVLVSWSRRPVHALVQNHVDEFTSSPRELNDWIQNDSNSIKYWACIHTPPVILVSGTQPREVVIYRATPFCPFFFYQPIQNHKLWRKGCSPRSACPTDDFWSTVNCSLHW